jgi:hypothetical protein
LGGLKDISEPMHFTVFNSTDRFYLDGELRAGEEIRNDPALLARVDFNGDGVVELDGLLKAKWNGMKNSLINGNIEGALNFHHGILKDRYDAIYDLLGSDFPILAQQMQDKELIYATGDRAKYRIKRDHNIDGQTVTITYYLQCFSIPRPLASGSLI